MSVVLAAPRSAPVSRSDGADERRLAVATLGVVALASAVMTVLRAGLSWDGAGFLFWTLHTRHDFVPWSRWTDYVWESPTLLAAHLTSNLRVLEFVFCLSVAAIPLLALTASYLVVRRQRPELFVWAVVGICVVTLPGQWFLTAEGIIALELGWPLLLLAICGVRGWRRGVAFVVMSGLVAFQHPFGVAVLALVAVVLLLPRLTSRAAPSVARTSYAGSWVLGVSALGLWRAVATHGRGDSQQFMHLSWLGYTVRVSLLQGGPAIGLVLLLAAAWLAISPGRANSRPMRVAAVALGALSCGVFAVWVSSRTAWVAEVDYRAAISVVFAACVALLVTDLALTRRSSVVDLRGRNGAALGLAVVYLVTLFVQGLTWHSLVGSLDRSIGSPAAPACRSVSDVPGLAGTPLDNWGAADLAILDQSRQPQHLVLDGSLCDRFREDGTVDLQPWSDPPAPTPPGWFSFAHVAKSSR